MWSGAVKRRHELAEWRRECRMAYWYRIFSDAESGTLRQVLYLDLAAHQEEQARLWHLEARKAGLFLPGAWTPGALEMAGHGLVLVLWPRWAGWLFFRLAVPGFSLYGRFQPRGLERLLAGIQDGLVSNACLIFGMAGIAQERPVLTVAGLLGLFFGAGLAGLGDWLAMERRLARLGKAGVPPDHLREGEEVSLTAMLRSRGVGEDHAARLTESLHEDPDRALRHMPLVVGGLGPGELDPPQGAALVGLLSFATGALVPLAGLHLAAAEWAVGFSAGLSVLALALLGMKRARLGGQPSWRGGVRAVLLGGAAVLAAWGLGHLLAGFL